MRPPLLACPICNQISRADGSGEPCDPCMNRMMSAILCQAHHRAGGPVVVTETPFGATVEALILGWWRGEDLHA